MTIEEALNEKIYKMLDMEIQKYCVRHDRHGNTYIISEGVKKGLIYALVPKIRELIMETID